MIAAEAPTVSQPHIDLRPNHFTRVDRHSYARLFAMDHFFGRPRVDKWFPQWRPNLHARMLASISQNGEGRCVPLPRYRNLDRDTYQRLYAKRNLPVVLEGAAKDWPCCRNWSFDWVKRNFGDEQVTLFRRDNPNESPLAGSVSYTTLAGLVDGLDDGSMRYARFHPLIQKHPELKNDFDREWLAQHYANHSFRFFENYVAFLGAKGSDTPPHGDAGENIFIQVVGRKKWHFYPITHAPIFDPPANRSVYKDTLFQPDNPDYDRYPMARHMDYYETVLEPGDVLYSPSYYWHHITNPEPSIGVSVIGSNIWGALRASPLFFTIDMFNTNPTMLQGLLMSLKDFNAVLHLNRNAGLFRQTGMVASKPPE